MSEEKIATLSEIESMPEFQNRSLDSFKNLKAIDYNLPMEDVRRQFSVTPETIKMWAERPEDTWFTRQAKGLWAGVARTGQQIQDLGQKFANYNNRHLFASADEQQAERLIALGMRQSANRAKYRAAHEQYEGTDDSMAAEISGAFASALEYAAVGGLGFLAGGPAGASAAVGVVAGLQEGIETSEQFAQKYIERTGDYSLKGYDLSNDAIAMGYGAISGFIESALGIEAVLAGSMKNAGFNITTRRLLLSGLNEGTEEFLQILAGGVAGKITGLDDRTWDDIAKDALKGAAYGALVGGTLGTIMYYYHRNRLSKRLQERYGLTPSEANIVANSAIDEAATQTEKEASTVVALQDHFGTAFDSLVTKVESTLDVAGWDTTQVDPKTNQPLDKHEYATTVASDIAFQVLRQAKINHVPVSDVLDLAEIQSIDNVLYLKPQKLGTKADIENTIKEKKAQVKRLTELAKTGAGNPQQKANLKTQIAVLDKLLDRKNAQQKAREDARPQELKDRSNLAKQDAKTLNKSNNVVDFAQKTSTPEKQVTPVEAKKRYDDARLMWLCDGNEDLFASLTEIGSTGTKTISGIMNVIDNVYQFAKDNPDLNLRQDIQGALERLVQIANRPDFAEFVSNPSETDIFGQNALLYAFNFGSADDITVFLNNYMDKVNTNKQDGKFEAGTFDKNDLYSQCLQMFESAFTDGVATDPNMRGVMLSKETAKTTPEQLFQIDETQQVSPLRYRDYDYIGKRIWTYDVDGKKHYIEPMIVLADDTVIPLVSLRDSIFPDKQVWALYKSEGGQSHDYFRDIWSKLIRNMESIIRGKDFGKMDNGTYENLAEADNKKLLLDALEKTKKEIQEENVSDADVKAQIAVVDNFIDNIKDGYIKPRFNEIVSLSDGTHLVTHGIGGTPESVENFLKAGKVYNPSLYISEKPSEYGYHSVVLFADPSILTRKSSKIFDRDAYTTTIGREPTKEIVVMPDEEKARQAMDVFNKYFNLEYNITPGSGSTLGDFAVTMERGLKNIKDDYYFNSIGIAETLVKKYIIADAIERGILDVDKTTLYRTQNGGQSLNIGKVAKLLDVPMTDHTIESGQYITDVANKALEFVAKQENKTRDEVLDSYKDLAVSRKEVVESTGEDATVANIAKAQRQHEKQSGRWRDVYASLNRGYSYNPEYELLQSSGETGILASIFSREIPFDAMVAEKGKTGKYYDSKTSRNKIRTLAIRSAKGNLIAQGKVYAAFLPPRVKKTDVDAYMTAMRRNPDNMYDNGDAKMVVAEIEKMAQRFAKIYNNLTKEEQKKLTSGTAKDDVDLEIKLHDELQKNHVKDEFVIDDAINLMEEVYDHPVNYFEGKVLADVGTNEFVGAYVNESHAWDKVAAMLEGQGVRVVRGSPADVKDATARLEEKIGQDIRFQGSKKQGAYDPELQVIIIGKDFNTGTLPHEMAHFWLDDIFRRATTQNDWTPEFAEQANTLFQIVGVEQGQERLTVEQQEKFARMVENVVFGLQPAPEGAVLPTLAYLNWIPPKYNSVKDIRYKGEDGAYHYPLLDKNAADFFNAWYSNANLPGLGSSPLDIQNENFTGKDGQVVPSTPEIMKLRDNDQKKAVDDQEKVDNEIHEKGIENTPTDTRSEIVGYNTEVSRSATTPEPVVQPQPKKKSLLRIGRGTNTRAEMIEEAQKYIEKNKDHAEEIAFGDPELVENDSGIERGILIREVMNNYNKGSQEYATLYDNLARTMSLAGKTGGLNNDIQVIFYLDGYSRLNRAMEAKAAAKYAGSNRGAITKFNQDIQKFIASKADAILATEPDSKERNDLIDAMIREAEIKFAGGTGDARMLFQENNFGQKARRQNKADFMKWADKEIKKMLKANPESDPKLISELITKSEKAQVARIQLDSTDTNERVAAAQVLRDWQAYTDKLDDTVLDNQISKLNRVFRKIVGSWQPFAMLTNTNTHANNMVSNTMNLGAVQGALYAQYGKSEVSKDLIKAESDRIWAVYNATQIDMSQMVNPATPSLLHGEKIDIDTNKVSWARRNLDTRVWLGKEDLFFRSKVYLSTLAHIATKNAKAQGVSANELFKQYCKLNQEAGSEAEQARQQAVLMGNIATFTQSGKLSGMLQKVRTEINKLTDPTGKAGFGTMLAPFLKTPANIVELGVRATFAPITDIKALIKGDWKIQDTLNTIYFVLALAVASALKDYEPEYEAGKKYDPTRPYDSITFGGGSWFKLDLFGAMETPIRFLASLKTNKGLGISGTVNATPLIGDIAESVSNVERASKSSEKLLNFGINYAYNQVNKSVPAIIKQTMNLANLTNANLQDIDIGIKTGIGRKLGRQYGLDAQDRTDIELWNDVLSLFFNRLKLTEQ